MSDRGIERSTFLEVNLLKLGLVDEEALENINNKFFIMDVRYFSLIYLAAVVVVTPVCAFCSVLVCGVPCQLCGCVSICVHKITADGIHVDVSQATRSAGSRSADIHVCVLPVHTITTACAPPPLYPLHRV